MRPITLLLSILTLLSQTVTSQQAPLYTIEHASTKEDILKQDQLELELTGRNHLKNALQFLNKNELEKALVEIKSALQYLESNSNVHFYHCLILSRLELHVEALQAILVAIKLEPENANLYYFAAMSWQKQGHYRESIPFWDAYIGRMSGSNRAYYYRGLAYYNINVYNKALEDLIKAVSTEPEHWEAFELLAQIYKEQGDFERAINYISMALEYNDRNEAAYLKRAELFETTARKDDANKDLEKARSLNAKAAAN